LGGGVTSAIIGGLSLEDGLCLLTAWSGRLQLSTPLVTITMLLLAVTFTGMAGYLAFASAVTSDPSDAAFRCTWRTAFRFAIMFVGAVTLATVVGMCHQMARSG
jgi:hypothetical protein